MNSILYIDDNGKAELYDDDYNITIFLQGRARAAASYEAAGSRKPYALA